jgi:hypothetical protein
MLMQQAYRALESLELMCTLHTTAVNRLQSQCCEDGLDVPPLHIDLVQHLLVVLDLTIRSKHKKFAALDLSKRFLNQACSMCTGSGQPL